MHFVVNFYVLFTITDNSARARTHTHTHTLLSVLTVIIPNSICAKARSHQTVENLTTRSAYVEVCLFSSCLCPFFGFSKWVHSSTGLLFPGISMKSDLVHSRSVRHVCCMRCLRMQLMRDCRFLYSVDLRRNSGNCTMLEVYSQSFQV